MCRFAIRIMVWWTKNKFLRHQGEDTGDFMTGETILYDGDLSWLLLLNCF